MTTTSSGAAPDHATADREIVVTRFDRKSDETVRYDVDEFHGDQPSK